METLQKYLEGRRKANFAEEIGTSPSYLSQLLSGHRRPSFRLMLKIQEATGGDVPVSAWVEQSGEDAA